ncbi:TPA: hypothetical protein ACGU2D_003866 [Vibrio vulnificus]
MAETEMGFLKVEAVNFGNTIFDTNQLSVVRGGSYALKEIVRQIEKKLIDRKIEGFQSVTLGGSTGIFCCDADSINQMRSLVELYLCDQQTIKEQTFTPNNVFSFVITSVVSKDYLQAKEQLYALGRHKQAQSFSHALPDFSSSGEQVCPLNGYLLADSKNNNIKAAKNSKVSTSVDLRYQIGRKVRTTIYSEEQAILAAQLSDLGKPQEERRTDIEELRFPSDLETLAGQHHKLALNGKVAVIYVDGNAFGKAQKTHIEQSSNKIEAQQAFDLQLRSDRAEYLVSLVEFLNQQGATLQENNETMVQLETLLWGGDEMTIVVPAWIGMATLHHFFEKHNNYQICGQPLTFSAGIVFASCKTPIRKLEQAAMSLADAIKQQSGGRQQSYFDYMILESIDYPTEPLASFWEKRYKKLAPLRKPLQFNLASSYHPDQLSQHLQTLPRSSIYKLVDAALHHSVADLAEQPPFNKEQRLEVKGSAQELPLMLKRLINAGGGELQTAIQALSQVLLEKGDEQATTHPLSDEMTLFWLHMLELYDYLAPSKPMMQEAQ